MKISDLLIIYFSAGAPFAVYSYLQNRARASRKTVLRDAASTFLFWLPAAARFIFKHNSLKKYNFRKSVDETSPISERDENLYRLQKRLEKILPSSDRKFSVFEFREAMERYVGLTLASQIETDEINEEFFAAAQNKNSALAAKCFGRRNRRRLCFHQTSARRDFLQILGQMTDDIAVRKEIGALAAETAIILKDFEAEKLAAQMFASTDEGKQRTRNLITEKDVWKAKSERRPPQQQPIAAFNSISTIMRATTRQAAATRSRKKD